MLAPVELNPLVDVVTEKLDEARLGMHVIACGRRIDAITPAVAFPMLVSRVLNDANGKEWLPALLDQLEGENGTSPVVVAACRTARTQWTAARRAAAPLAPQGRRDRALVLFNKSPFIDRAPARPLVDEAVQLAGRRVLVVRGRDAVGKSHLGSFVRHLVNGVPGTRMALVRLNDLDAERVQARDLMEALAATMGLGADPKWDNLAQDARQADKLVRWLIGKLNATSGNGPRWVLVLDEIDHPRVAPGAVELVNRLIGAAASGELVDTSLVAIALPCEVPPGVAGVVIEHELAPLTATEVRDHIDELARTVGVALTPAQLDAMTAWVLEGLQFPLDRSGMDTVRERMATLQDTILKGAA